MRERGDAETSRRLSEDFSRLLPELVFVSPDARARFFHNAAVFFGSSGPAADLSRARECFSVALDQFSEHAESGWRARILHNLATALSNLGETAEELTESVALFEEALAWRTSQREIARGVTLHNLGLALRRLCELAPDRSQDLLERSAGALREAVRIRSRHALAEGEALSLFHLALTLERQGDIDESRASFEQAAERFERLGKSESAAIAAGRAASL